MKRNSDRNIKRDERKEGEIMQINAKGKKRE